MDMKLTKFVHSCLLVEHSGKKALMHDWHWNDLSRENFYKGLEGPMKNFGIEFIPIVNGVQIEV